MDVGMKKGCSPTFYQYQDFAHHVRLWCCSFCWCVHSCMLRVVSTRHHSLQSSSSSTSTSTLDPGRSLCHVRSGSGGSG